MRRKIRDPDVCILASVAAQLQGEYDEDNGEDPWQDSPFAWILRRPSRQVGKIGEQLISGFFAAKGLDVVKSPDGEADRMVEGKRVEIKFSTLWKNGSYKFQQIRDQNYSYVVCLGISPFTAHCWIIPKHLARRHAPGQHTGRSARDTRWLTVNPTDVPPWLTRWGGTLRKAIEVLQ